ncbi:MAG: hypothetical protein GY756_13025 [bacterium]|nr:hypothetical protein [bacterium]
MKKSVRILSVIIFAFSSCNFVTAQNFSYKNMKENTLSENKNELISTFDIFSGKEKTGTGILRQIDKNGDGSIYEIEISGVFTENVIFLFEAKNKLLSVNSRTVKNFFTRTIWRKYCKNIEEAISDAMAQSFEQYNFYKSPEYTKVEKCVAKYIEQLQIIEKHSNDSIRIWGIENETTQWYALTEAVRDTDYYSKGWYLRHIEQPDFGPYPDKYDVLKDFCRYNHE